MFSDYYSFTREEDNDIEYTFSSVINDIVYYVSFGINDYDTYLDEYPTLLQKGYSFGFQKKNFSPKRSIKDEAVFPTIYKIIEDFMFSNIDRDTVLLYHCDIKDNMQACRHRLFTTWGKMVTDTELFKYSVQVKVQKPGDDFKTDYYLGFITYLNNPNLDLVKDEFEKFSYNIIQPKS